MNQDGFQIYDSNYSDFPSALKGPVTGPQGMMAKNVNEEYAVLGSQQPGSHLGGYAAPVNSAMASEAEYGHYFGPTSSNKVNNLNLHVEPPSYRQEKLSSKHPKTSSPVGGGTGYATRQLEQDLTLSPLVAENGPSRESEYNVAESMAMGAPDQLATFVNGDFPSMTSVPSPKPGFGVPKGNGKKRFQPRHRSVPEDEDETQSKVSSSVYSSRSGSNPGGGGKKRTNRNKKPNRRRNRSEVSKEGSSATFEREGASSSNDDVLDRTLSAERKQRAERRKAKGQQKKEPPAASHEGEKQGEEEIEESQKLNLSSNDIQSTRETSV